MNLPFSHPFDHIPIGLYRATPAGQLLDANLAMASLLGYLDRQSLLQVNLTHLYVDPAERRRCQAMLARDGAVQHFDMRLQRLDGTVIWVENNAQAVRDDGGRVIYYEGSLVDITERKRIEEELKSSQDYARNIIDSSLDMIIAVDANRRIIEFNKAAQETFGYRLEEVIGKEISFLYADAPAGLSVHKATQERGQYTQEIWNRRKNGEVFPCFLSASVLRNARGEPVGLMGISRDITEIKRAEEALAAEKERLALTLRSIGDGVITTDTEGKVTLFNAMAEKLTGWTQAEAQGRDWQEIFRIINSKTGQMAENPVSQVLERGVVIGLAADTALVAKDGTVRQISSSIAPIWEANGLIAGVVLVFRDITRLKEAEEKLRLSEERFRLLAENARDLIYLYRLTPTRQFEYVSPAVTAITGYPPAAYYADAELMLKLVHPDDRLQLVTAMQSPAVSSTPLILRWQRKDGKLTWTEHRIMPINDESGNLVAIEGIVSDITERKRTEEERIRAERLSALGRLAAALAHEINNPLQAIQSTLDLVLDFDLEQEERDHNLQIIRQEINRLIEVTRRILNFARPSQVPRQPVVVSDLVRQTVALAGKHLQHAHVQPIADLPPLPPVLVVPEQMTQVFLNLILNAVEAMSSGGHIYITTRTESDQIAVTFRNDGPAIPPEDLPHIFDPFFTTKPGGSGLGLWVCHTLVQQHQGTIVAENLKDGKGVAFTVRLPMAPSPAPEAKP